MLRSGQFDNLGWDTLAKAHTANWELLRSRFGISFAQIPPLASLVIYALSDLLIH